MKKCLDVLTSIFMLFLFLAVAGGIVKIGADLGGSSWLGIPFFVKLASVMDPVFSFTIGDLITGLRSVAGTAMRWFVPTVVTLFGLALGIGVVVGSFIEIREKLRPTPTT